MRRTSYFGQFMQELFIFIFIIHFFHANFFMRKIVHLIRMTDTFTGNNNNFIYNYWFTVFPFYVHTFSQYTIIS